MRASCEARYVVVTKKRRVEIRRLMVIAVVLWYWQCAIRSPKQFSVACECCHTLLYWGETGRHFVSEVSRSLHSPSGTRGLSLHWSISCSFQKASALLSRVVPRDRKVPANRSTPVLASRATIGITFPCY